MAHKHRSTRPWVQFSASGGEKMRHLARKAQRGPREKLVGGAAKVVLSLPPKKRWDWNKQELRQRVSYPGGGCF